MDAKSTLRELIKRVPLVGKPYQQRDELRAITNQLWQEPGHFYSPIPSLHELRRREHIVFGDPVGGTLAGIRLDDINQRLMLERLSQYYADQPFQPTKLPEHRFGFENPAFSYCDAIVWHCMLRAIRPKRVIEVGSGYSSCVLLDTNAMFLEGSVACTFIEPYPKLLHSLIRDEDRASSRVIATNLQEVPLETFETLEAGDVLFIDSSHVSKTDSDVNYAFFEILPRLAPHVYVHVHDVFYPFEYPKDWVYQGRSWNEAYLLRAFLQFNEQFEIVLWNSYVEQRHREWFENMMPLCLKSAASGNPATSAQSIWLQRL